MLGMIFVVLAALFVVLPVLSVLGVFVMAVLSGAAVLFVSGAFAGKGILLGIVLGYVLYRTARKNRIREEAD